MRHLISAAVVAVAVVFQLAAADRMVFPGGTGPDLVLLTVAALAIATGPLAGSVAGFCAGLALDVAPPAGHLVGQDALVSAWSATRAGSSRRLPPPTAGPSRSTRPCSSWR